MQACRVARGIVPGALTVLLAGMSGCSPPGPELTTPSPSPQPTSSTVCLEAQMSAADRLAWPWWRATDAVMRSPSGQSARAGKTWQRALARVAGNISSRGCPDPPPEMVDVLQASQAAGGLDVTELGDLVTELKAWTERVGADGSQLAKDLEHDAFCLEHREDLARVGYVVRSVPAPHGRDMWVDLVVENLTPELLIGGVSGRLRVAGAVQGTQTEVTWGGSSADDLWAPRHQTVRKPLLAVDGERLHVGDDGRLTDIKISVGLDAGPGRYNRCVLPVLALDDAGGSGS